VFIVLSGERKGREYIYQSELVNGEALTARCKDASAGSACEAESGDAQFWDLEHTDESTLAFFLTLSKPFHTKEFKHTGCHL